MQWYIGVHKLSQLTLSQLTQHSSTNTASTQEQMSVPLINSLEDVISTIGPIAGEGEEYLTQDILETYAQRYVAMSISSIVTMTLEHRAFHDFPLGFHGIHGYTLISMDIHG